MTLKQTISFNLTPRACMPLDQWLWKVLHLSTVGLGDAHSGYKIEFAYNYYESYLNARKNLTYSGQLLNKYLVSRFFSSGATI